jgi:type II secretory pathway pseudopilin PulG
MLDHANYTSTERPSKGIAIASLVLGIISIPTLGLLFVGGIAGIVLGIVALNKLKTDPVRYSGKGLAIAGIVTSALALLLAIPGIIAALAIPGLLKSQQAAREAAAINEVRTIGQAQLMYSLFKGRGQFADLHTLAAHGLVDSALGSTQKGGYLYTTEPIIEKGFPLMFDTTARPVNAGTFGAGNRSFYSNETNVIWEADGGEPPKGTSSDRVPKNGRMLE